jgi:riboflavin-specific deaminase-like protein
MSIAEPGRLAAGHDNEIALVWEALIAAVASARGGQAGQTGVAYGIDAGGLCRVKAADSRAFMSWQAPDGWACSANAPAPVRAVLDLYLPVANASPASPLTVGHLGQGLDGYIATRSGDSVYVTGPENILHLHRMRALCDAVMVGAETVANDDPRLTTRRAPGNNPTRIILDPHRRLPPTHGVFSDDAAPTLLVCEQARAAKLGERVGMAEVLGVPLHAGRFDLEALLHAIRARGLVSIFVEGGGQTVSAFLEAGLLDRLQVAVAPLLTGAGRPGIRLPARQTMKDCLRPPHRLFRMGEDILYDFDLRSSANMSGNVPANGGLSRIR